MSEPWAIAIFSLMTSAMVFIAKCIWDIKNTFRHFVTEKDCSNKMCEHAKEINLLRKAAETNQKKLAQIQPIIELKHGIRIDAE